MVDSLASVVNDGIARVEKEVLPVSRHNGIRSLPTEIMATIMTLAGDQLFLDPDAFKKLMWTFFDVTPFDAYVKDAKAMLKTWRQLDSVWVGYLPQVVSPATLTRFHFSAKNNYTLHRVRTGLKLLTALEHLDISCCFNRIKIFEGEDLDAVIVLRRLRSLSVSNLAQTDSVKEDERLAKEPLKRIIRMLAMPNLTTIRALLHEPTQRTFRALATSSPSGNACTPR